MQDAYLRAFVTDIFVEGGDPARPYGINYETANFAAAGIFRVRVFLFDAASGANVAMWSLTSDSDFSKTQPGSIVLTQGTGAYTGITAFARIDWSKIDWTKGLTTYATAEEAGIVPDRVIDRQTIMTRFAAASEPKLRLTVGAGGQFPTFAAAVESLYIKGIALNRGTFPCSDITSFSNQVLIECVQPGYSERIETKVIQGISQSLLIPPFVTLRGRGDTRLFLPPDANDAPVLEAPFSIAIEDIVLDSGSTGYAIHIDDNNAYARRSEIVPVRLNYPLASIMRRVTFFGSPKQASWLLGVGIGNGHLLRLDDCRVRTAAGMPGLGAHNSPNTTDAGRVEIVRSSFDDGAGRIEFIKSFAMDVQHQVAINASGFARLDIVNTAGGAEGFVRV